MTFWRSQARLPEIAELEKQIKATNEELADAHYKAREDASTAAAMHKALQDSLEQARTEVGHCSHSRYCCHHITSAASLLLHAFLHVPLYMRSQRCTGV